MRRSMRIAPVNPLAGATGQSNKLVAGLLALFLGTIGIHKFYLGYNKAGLTMLLVSVFGVILLFIPTFIMAVIAFVEAIIYLMATDDEWHQKYVVNEHPGSKCGGPATRKLVASGIPRTLAP